MLWALGQPAALAGLLVAFALSVLLRAAAQHLVIRRTSLRRPRLFEPRRDIDVFGAVAAVIGGTGWGRRLDKPGVFTILAGPIAVFVASQLVFAAYIAVDPTRLALRLGSASDILRGVPGTPIPQFVLSVAVGMLCFALLAMVPLPPLDGWELVARRAGNRPGPGFAKAAHWLDDQNIGVVILLVGLLLPLVAGRPLILYLLDVVTTPVFWLWT